MSNNGSGSIVMVTGASGFVGRYVVRELVARGHTAICPVRNEAKLRAQTHRLDPDAVVPVPGDPLDERVLVRCLEHADAVIHLIGIISESRSGGQTFERVHVDGTRQVLHACERAGVRRYVHMSALGAREGTGRVSRYHQTKWRAEEAVRRSIAQWTILRPSLIHGPEGEFMQMMKFFATSLRQPVMPYFGRGDRSIQPVHVKDVAACFVGALSRPETILKTYDLGGPERYTWKELYDTCALAIAGRKRVKVSVPVLLAKLAARTIVPLMPAVMVPYKFNVDQVIMSQEDNVCDTAPAIEAFDVRLRPFRAELERYADQIRQER
jgi:NADH dehydrogenase